MTAIGNKDIVELAKVKPLIFWFLGLTLLFTAPFQWLMIHKSMAQIYIFASMWAPGVAALAACRIVGVDISILGFKWGKNKWILMAYLLPLGYGFVIYGITWFTGHGIFFDTAYITKVGDNLGLNGWNDIEVLLFAVPLYAIIWMPIQMASALGEELGWRGLLGPQLMRLMSFPAASLTSGLIWFLWHVPIIVWGSYMIEYRPEMWQIGCFAIMLIGASFPMMYYRLKSGSVWTGAVFHASHNLFFVYIFLRLTKSTPTTKFYAGEWGIFTASILAAIGLYYWHKAHKEGLRGPLNCE